MRPKYDRSSISKKAQLGREKEAEFNFGYFYRTVEEHVDTFAAQAGNPFTIADIAVRVGELLRLKTKDVREASGAAELVSQVRETSAKKRTALAAKKVDVGPRTRRTLSAAGRRKIAKVQRERWAKIRAEKAGKKKRVLSKAQITTMRENAKTARAALARQRLAA